MLRKLGAVISAAILSTQQLPAQDTAALLFTAEPAFDFAVAQPVAIVSAPGDSSRLFLVEKSGRILVITNPARPTREVFLDLGSRASVRGREEGLLALAFHPNFRQNRQFFIWYTGGGEDRLSRFRVSAENPNRADPASEEILIAQPDDAQNHNGGELLFGPDGYLYLSIGDEGRGNDQLQNSQRIDKDFFSTILRLDVDRRSGSLPPNPHPGSRAGTYAIPPDNPFVGARTFNGEPVDPANTRTEMWAVGFRNPWRMAFDATTGALWVGDVGQSAFEEVDIAVKGGNYGWNYREGLHPGPRGVPVPQPRDPATAGTLAGAQFKEPVWEYPRTAGTCITGGFVYRGDLYPKLKGKYLFADYDTGRVWALTPDGDRTVGADRVEQIARALNVAAFGLNPQTGEILLASHTANRILKLVPSRP